MMNNVSGIIKASMLFSATLLLSTTSAFSQAVVTDISSALWQKLPKGYDLSNCGFIPKQDAKNVWWACELYQGSEERTRPAPAFVWVLPIDNSGNLGSGLLGDSVGMNNHPWISILAFGTKNSLLAMDDRDQPVIAALEIPGYSVNQPVKLPVLWQYLPNNQQEKLSVTQAIATDNGGYAFLLEDFSDAADEQEQDSLTVVQVTDQGQERWQYHYAKALPAGTKLKDYFDENGLIKNIFITRDQKIIIYGDGYQEADFPGTFLLCLNAEGKEISNQFFNSTYWDKSVDWAEHGFGFVNYAGLETDDETNQTTHPYITLFNKNCQKTADLRLHFPSHTASRETYEEIKATVVAPNGNLWVVYTQKELPKDYFADNDQAEPLLPSLYLAEFNQQGEAVQDIGLMTGQDKNRDYLQFFVDGEGGVDTIKTTLVILPQTNEVLISVHNMGVTSETGDEELQANPYPRLYRVKLP